LIPSASPSQFPTEPVCPDNLGDSLSGGTGNNTVDPYPHIEFSTSPAGNDDSASMLVCGDLDIRKGSEIEGKIVVIGNMDIGSGAGFLSLIRAGWGSHIVPNNGTDAIVVGGDLTINASDITFMYPGYGNIVHKGNFEGHVPQEVNVGNPPNWDSGESYIFQDSNYDLTPWTEACTDIEAKGPYWAQSLSPNCIVEGIGSNTITFKAGDADPLQICHITCEDLSFYVGRHVRFDASLDDRTVMINVRASNDGTCDVCNLANFFDTTGKGRFEFSTEFVKNILWNFYNAKEVRLGCDCSAVGEWQGSIIVPEADSTLEFCMPGHSGRLVVNGDMIHNKEGSEFHNYPFDPPVRPPCPPVPPSESPNNNRRDLRSDTLANMIRAFNW